MLLLSHTVWLWTLLNYAKLWREEEEELKNSIQQFFFWWGGSELPLSDPALAPLSLPLHPYSLPPTFPLLFIYKEGRWVIDDNTADPCYFHTHTRAPFPPTGLVSLSLLLLWLSHE